MKKTNVDEVWDIISFERIGPLEFSMSREEVRELLGEDFESFRKGPDSKSTTDAYNSIGIHLYYDNDDLLEFVEVANPCRPVYKSVSLLESNFPEVAIKLRRLGDESADMSSGTFFPKSGFSLYVPYGDRIEAVGVYRHDKFEKSLQLWTDVELKRKRRRRNVNNPFDSM